MLRSLQEIFKFGRRRKKTWPAICRAFLAAEQLELREVPAFITVNSTADGSADDRDGVVTLREALSAAIARTTNAESDVGVQLEATTQGITAIGGNNPITIKFAIPNAEGDSGYKHIELNSELPPITGVGANFITIDGYTQHKAQENTSFFGFDGKVTVELSGLKLPATASGLRFTDDNIRPYGITVRGLAFIGFGKAAISLKNVGLTTNAIALQGNLIGTTSAVDSAAYGNGRGIVIEGNDLVQIGGSTASSRNVIVNSKLQGIYIADANLNPTLGSPTAKASVKIANNLIGTRDGTTASPNAYDGIWVNHSNEVFIGGAIAAGDEFFANNSPAAGNVISGNGIDGVDVTAGDNEVVSAEPCTP